MLYYRPVRKKGVSPKLKSFWEGPFTVEKALGTNIYVLMGQKGERRVAQYEQLKRFTRREEAVRRISHQPARA